MENRPKGWKWAIAVAAVCLLASLDIAGEAGHWMVQKVWTQLTGTRIDSKQDPLLWVSVLQKTVHVFLFGTLGVFLGSGRGRIWKLAGGMLLCVFAEWIQTLSETRSASWLDVSLNMVSFVAGFFLVAPLWRARVRG